MRKATVFIFLLLYSLTTLAQEVQFMASGKTNVAVGEQFYISYVINQKGSDFKAPPFRDFNLLTGPNQSSSTSIQWVNGQTTQTVSISYTYMLQAVKEGVFSIPAASIIVDGKKYFSNTLTISVTKGSQNVANNPNNQNNTNANASGKGLSANDIFIRTVVSKSSAYKGEALLLTHKIYTKYNISGFEEIKLPSYNGFWTEELKKVNNVLKRESYNGVTYYVAELKKTIIIPQIAGKLKIEPADITVIAQIPVGRRSGSIWDDFFGPSVNEVRYKTQSKPVTIEVKDLPSAGQPEDFNGAVGKFSMSANLDRNSVKTNEAVTLSVSISGTGNIKLIDNLNINFPVDFEIYDPKITGNINTTESGLTGTRKFEYLMIPRNHGKFQIKPFTFSYFDINSKTYKTLTSGAFDIEVLKGSGADNVTFRSSNQEDVKYIGSDIRFIKNTDFALYRTGYFFFNSKLFYILLISPVIIFIVFVVIYRHTLKQRSNINAMKNRLADKVARKRLKQAEMQLKENNKAVFYEEVSKALWGYLSDKFNIPLSDLSIETVNDVLKSKMIDEDITSRLVNTLHDCEYARFAPAENSHKMQEIYTQAASAIRMIENQVK